MDRQGRTQKRGQGYSIKLMLATACYCGRLNAPTRLTQNASQFELQLPRQGAEAPREFNMRVQTEDMQGMHSFAESRERSISKRR